MVIYKILSHLAMLTNQSEVSKSSLLPEFRAPPYTSTQMQTINDETAST